MAAFESLVQLLVNSNLPDHLLLSYITSYVLLVSKPNHLLSVVTFLHEKNHGHNHGIRYGVLAGYQQLSEVKIK